jgi:predicted nucleotidyltransferase
MNKVPEKLRDLVNFLIGSYKPEMIILFGSYGTEMEDKNSDIDLLIVKETSKTFVEREVELIQLIRDRFGFEYPVEPLIYTPKEFKKAKRMGSLFIRSILEKGKQLYGEE